MRQPSGSKIQLTSKADRLELTIPARFRPDRAAIHQLGLAGLINFIVLILIALTIYISAPLSIPNTDLAVKVGLGVALMFILPLTLWLLKGGFKLSFDLAEKFLSQTIVTIDRHQFTLSQHLYGLERIRPKHLKTREITQVIVDNYQHPDLKVPKVSLMLELRQIDPIRILSTGQDLTEREIKWMARELSNWLGVNLITDSIDLDS
ncbi:hypothetical protein [Chamaesiphon sp. VAR_48_metabat_135_sub]|uniref:hypothetical protein n=1 Tax=Chamaesiphon sp. VAR_48_metabat_135_sub TaxID=2964699 RepID=UPI00286C652E|nr:hypothetical protein [Chamaesiphon sp. VAR_48_metabat_135_sub]